MLLNEFAFFPSEVFAFALSALNRGGGISDPTVPTDFHVEPVFLGYGFLNWV